MLYIATWCLSHGMGLTSAGIATGISHVDAVSGASLCGLGNSPLLLISDDDAQNTIDFYGTYQLQFMGGYAFGGTSVLSNDAYISLEEAVAHA